MTDDDEVTLTLRVSKRFMDRLIQLSAMDSPEEPETVAVALLEHAVSTTLRRRAR